MRQDAADPGLGEQVTAHPGDQQVLLLDEAVVRDLHVVGDHVQEPDVESLLPADELDAGDDGNLLSLQKADPAAEEGDEVASPARRQPGDLDRSQADTAGRTKKTLFHMVLPLTFRQETAEVQNKYQHHTIQPCQALC